MCEQRDGSKAKTLDITADPFTVVTFRLIQTRWSLDPGLHRSVDQSRKIERGFLPPFAFCFYSDLTMTRVCVASGYNETIPFVPVDRRPSALFTLVMCCCCSMNISDIQIVRDRKLNTICTPFNCSVGLWHCA